MNELAEEFEKQVTCLGKNTKKYITFSVPLQKEVTEIDRNEKKLEKPYPIDYNLVIAQDLRQAHYQVLLVTR